MTEERILDMVVVGERGQITLTKPVREKFKIKPRDRVFLVEKGGELVIRKV
jgi:AbrB family looped-hinge helix DNA binding protein